MSRVGAGRGLAGYGGGLLVGRWGHRNTTNGRQGKRLALRAAQVVGWIRDFEHSITAPCWRSRHFLQGFQRFDGRRCPFQPALRP
jgi:hypothetical protein